MMEEMMVSLLQKMTGLSPDQMQDMANKAMGLLDTFAKDMAEVKAGLARIENILADVNGQVIDPIEKALEHVQSKNDD